MGPRDWRNSALSRWIVRISVLTRLTVLFVGFWPVVSTASARSLHEKRSVELINVTLIATARYA